MKSEAINELLTGTPSMQELVVKFFPTLTKLDMKLFEESNLGNTSGSDNLTDTFRSMGDGEKKEVSTSAPFYPAEDLMEIQSMSERELNARKGLALLEQSRDNINSMVADMTAQLRKLQSIRELGMFELARRTRAKAIADGQPPSLDQFTSRYIFGPPPAPTIIPGTTDELGKRTWFRARVPSGKQVAVESIRYTIPQSYEYWLIGEMEKAGCCQKKPYHHYALSVPRNPTQLQARLFYKLGFMPDKQTTVNYRIQHYGGGHSNTWYLSHSRETLTKDLVPLD